MSINETDLQEESGTYIGDFLAQDVCAFCNVTWQDGMNYNDKRLGIVRKVWNTSNGYHSFSPVAGLFSVDWLIYRGMLPQAFVVQGLSIVSIYLINHLFNFLKWEHSLLGAIIVTFLLLFGAMGHVSVNLYEEHIGICLEKYGLKKRKNIECKELSESLQKQGKPSIMRVVLYRVILHMLIVCAYSIWLTMQYR